MRISDWSSDVCSSDLQSSEITVPLEALLLTGHGLRSLERRFEDEFEKTYGHRSPHKQFELVTVRLVASVSRHAEHSGAWAPDTGSHGGPRERMVYFGARHGRCAAQVLRRPDLAARPRPG